MTDATPDPLTDEPTSAPDEGPEFVVTPTLRAFTELVERVDHLEASAPALDDDDTDPDEATQARLTRHRTEIEQIKTTINALIRYVTSPGSPAPQPIPPAPVAAAPAAPAPTPGVTP